ncbi:MAG: superoxide dismutase [Bacteroidota bacterium]
MSYKLPDLNYDFDALEPFADSRTMEIHYKGHHAAYLEKFNKEIKDTFLEDKTPYEIFENISQYPEEVRNNGGGFYNHSLFWRFLSPEKQSIKNVFLSDSINQYFGTYENMKREFSEIAANHFGSGWIWLIKRFNGELVISSTPNQDNPIMETANIRGNPILCLDVWEHAYYLKHQNRRKDYIEAFWNFVNWERVAELYNR